MDTSNGKSNLNDENQPTHLLPVYSDKALLRGSATPVPESPFGLTQKELSMLITPSKDHTLLAQYGGVQSIIEKLGTNESLGLSSKEGVVADESMRIAAFGKNKLPTVKPKPLWKYMLAALSDKIMILLSVVSVVSLAIGVYEDVKEPDPSQRVHWVEGFSVLVAVVIVVLASSINDLQKEKQFRKLNAKKEDRTVKGVRDGNIQLISIYDILVGDVLLLEPGDVIAADGVFISGMGLRCDESSATGETDTIKKGLGHDQLIVSGSKVTEGIGRYVVTAVGEHSFFGSIMMAMRTEAEDTPLQIKLDGLADRIAKLGTAFAILLFLLLFLKYVIVTLKTTGFGSSDQQQNAAQVAQQLVNILLVSIAIVAVAVPEGLPLAVTLALAYATTRMMKDNNLVRVLSACETMGNATTICSDKTGTLTQNRMTVTTGVVGKNAMFEGDFEIENFKRKLETLPSKVQVSAIQTKAGKQPGPSPSDLLSNIMEGVALNSSAFDGINEQTGKPELVGSKTEIALLDWAQKSGFDYKEIRNNTEKVSVVQVFPFSSERKSMATLVKVNRGDGQPPLYRMHVKGASEIVMRYCDRVVLLPFQSSASAIQSEAERLKLDTSAGLPRRLLSVVPAVGSRSNPLTSLIYPFEEKIRTDYDGIITSFASQSLRTICMAYRDFTEQEFEALVHGALSDRVAAARKEEQEREKEKLIQEAHEGVYRNTDFLSAPVDAANTTVVELSQKPAESVLLKPEDQSGRGSSGSSASGLLAVPQMTQGQNGETRSFIESHLSEDDEQLTLAEILAHPLAWEELASRHLILSSLVGIEDPLRPGVIEAVKACQNAGVLVRMVTGDNIMTAKSIASKCGIYSRDFGEIVMEGEVFRALSDERMAEVIPNLRVLARSSPLDKQILVSKLKSMGETVAVTGDGTNDGPALKMADIGFSMGIAGTEVAKEASSIILMDDSFSSVVKAILWGRSVNDAVKKFLQFQLSVNISAVLITLISALVDSKESSALTVVQLLWVNLIMDTFAALALATELPTDELLQRPPDAKNAPLISFTMWKMISGQAFLQLTVNLVVLFGGPYLMGFTDLIDAGGITGIDDGTNSNLTNQKLILKTMVFNSFVILQVFSLINSRRIDNHINVFKGILKNIPFVTIFFLIVVGQILIVQFGGVVFQTQGLTGLQWLVCIIAGSLSIPWGMILRLLPNDIFKSLGFDTEEKTAHHAILEISEELEEPKPHGPPTHARAHTTGSHLQHVSRDRHHPHQHPHTYYVKHAHRRHTSHVHLDMDGVVADRQRMPTAPSRFATDTQSLHNIHHSKVQRKRSHFQFLRGDKRRQSTYGSLDWGSSSSLGSITQPTSADLDSLDFPKR